MKIYVSMYDDRLAGGGPLETAYDIPDPQMAELVTREPFPGADMLEIIRYQETKGKRERLANMIAHQLARSLLDGLEKVLDR
jgi:hypothetical protein